MTPNFEAISTLATRAIAAEAHHSKAAASLAAAREAREVVATRLADLVGKRQEIVVRHAEGDFRDDDAEALAVLAADIDGLQLLIGRHDGVVSGAEGPVRAAADAAVAVK